MIESIISLISLAMLVYIYGGYFLILKLLAYSCPALNSSIAQLNENELPLITVLVTVFNEASVIEARVKNILACCYPKEKIEVIVASDGSTDGTDEIVKKWHDKRVRLFRPNHRTGKTDTQNQAVKIAHGEIIVFTDADTRFDENFLLAIAQPFADARVGGVDGHLLFTNDPGSPISQSQNGYWRQELAIRGYESRLGILAVASGACLAIRRCLFRPMTATVGEDCLIPLDIVDQGFMMVHVNNALAYDRMPSDANNEFRTRIRMTLRNWQGTWMYPNLLNIMKYPGVAFALWSHKILRWLSPFFLIGWILFGLININSSFPTALLGWFALAFVFLAVIGFISIQWHHKIPIFGSVYSFCLANAGFLIGVLKAVLGKRITSYK